MADLEHARSYLPPSRFEHSPLARIAWHAWPAAILVALIAFVSLWQVMHPTGTGQMLEINALQNMFDAPKIAVMVALFATFHVLANLVALFLDRSHSVPMRILNVLSIVPSLLVIVGCAFVYVLFTDPRALTP